MEKKQNEIQHHFINASKYNALMLSNFMAKLGGRNDLGSKFIGKDQRMDQYEYSPNM